MKIASLLLVFLACNTASKNTSTTTSDTHSTASAKVESPLANIVPPVFEDGKLVKIEKSEAEWKALLSEQEFYVLRKEGTERSFTGDLWDNHEVGTFICRGCGLPLFESATKFESGTGWPSFYQPSAAAHVTENRDESYGMTRIEVECARCGGHLGHVFDDGPRPTELRYCINSASLDFVK